MFSREMKELACDFGRSSLVVALRRSTLHVETVGVKELSHEECFCGKEDVPEYFYVIKSEEGGWCPKQVKERFNFLLIGT